MKENQNLEKKNKWRERYGKFITVRVEEDTLKLIEKLGFDSRSQFVRFAIRYTLARLIDDMGLAFDIPGFEKRIGKGRPLLQEKRSV